MKSKGEPIYTENNITIFVIKPIRGFMLEQSDLI